MDNEILSVNNLIVQKEITINVDANVKRILELLNHKVKYENSIILVATYGETPPTRGNYTLNNLKIYHNGTAFSNSTHCYLLGKVSPNSFLKSGTFEYNNSFFIQDGILKSNSSSINCLGTVGSKVKLVEIPVNNKDLSVDFTPYNN